MVKKKLIQNISNPKKKQSKICLSRNVFGYKRKTDPKIFGKKENFGIKSFWVEFFIQESFQSKRVWGTKKVGSRNFSPKNYWGKKNLFRSPKHVGKKENFGIKSFWVEFFSKKICNPKEFEEQKRLSHEILVKKIIGGRKFYLGVQNMFVVGSFGSFKHLYTI